MRSYDKEIPLLPPIVQRAIQALIKFEDDKSWNEMGYDISYYQEDLPEVVKKAIEPWKAYDD